MSFWSFNTAAPTLINTLGYSKVDFLRKTPAKFPKTLSGFTRYRRLFIADMDILATLLRENYGDSDWYLDVGPWLKKYLDDPYVIVLGLFNNDGSLCASIFSTPLTKELSFIMKKPYQGIRVIEGLCVHRSVRKTGIAGYMISAMDHETSLYGPCMHIYSRELVKKPHFSTHLNMKTYAYIKCSEAQSSALLESMTLGDFMKLWDSNILHWNSSDILVSGLSNRRGDIRIWKTVEEIVVIVDTKRRTKAGDLPIWEVIWCGLYDLKLDLLKQRALSFKTLESVAALYGGLFFIMTEHALEKLPAPWKVGQSGVHAWYIYNFITPKFGSCEIQVIREEI